MYQIIDQNQYADYPIVVFFYWRRREKKSKQHSTNIS